IDSGVTVYFCDPRSPWQRGSNENTNGLLRQYFPKRTSLAPFSQADLDHVADELNGRPRQTLNWMTPSEALDDALRRSPPVPPTRTAIETASVPEADAARAGGSDGTPRAVTPPLPRASTTAPTTLCRPRRG